MGTCIVFTSGKGGTGKTTAVSAIASCLAARGKKTLCIDMDLRLRNLDLLLGLADRSALDLEDVTAGRAAFEDAVLPHPDIANLSLLAGPAGLEGSIDQGALGELVEAAKAVYDYCLIDTPAGMGSLFYVTAQFADQTVILCTSDATSLRDGQRVVMELDGLGHREIRMIVNRARIRLISRSAANVDDMIDFVGVPLLGLVPEDVAVARAAALQKPLTPGFGGKAAAAFMRIAGRIEGEALPLKYK